MFQHTAARRRLLFNPNSNTEDSSFNTQPRGGGCLINCRLSIANTSFNTQPRGGGCLLLKLKMIVHQCFNTQPRGGGCAQAIAFISHNVMFQHTAARRRLLSSVISSLRLITVSTHSRAEAAASQFSAFLISVAVSTHSRAEAAAPDTTNGKIKGTVSTHSRAEAAALIGFRIFLIRRFQHTAARRRLPKISSL